MVAGDKTKESSGWVSTALVDTRTIRDAESTVMMESGDGKSGVSGEMQNASTLNLDGQEALKARGFSSDRYASLSV